MMTHGHGREPGLKHRGLLALAVLLVPVATAAHAVAAKSPSCPWLNTHLTTDRRVQMVLSKMTMDEKLSLTTSGGSTKGRATSPMPAIPRLCLPAIGLTDGAGGVGALNTGTTAFPAPVSQAAAFDTATQKLFGETVGDELIRKGLNDWLAPNVNITRYPLGGRSFEQYGEDPFLSGQTAVAAIRGAQSRHVIATVKHFIGNESEDNRTFEDSRIDDRTLHEIYLSPFSAAVQQGQVASVMCAYNRINGPYSCSSQDMLTTELKHRLGFRGFVVSDWNTGAHFVTDANAGLDVEMPNPIAFKALKQAVQLGVVPESRLDDMARRVLWAEFAAGLVDHPVDDPSAVVATPGHLLMARHMAANGSVLLKNDGQLLPITQHKVTIAVVGPVGPSGAGNVCTGGGSASVDCAGSKTPQDSLLHGSHGPDALAAIRARARRDGDKVLFADGSDTAAVTDVARKADYVVAFGYYTEGEGQNRHSLRLDGSGDTYIAAAAAANKHTAVVLETGGPVLMPWLGSVRSVLEAWYGGVEGSAAIADMVFGDQSPGGRLPVTFPRSAADLPTASNPLQLDYSPIDNYSEGLDVGYRWYDAKKIAPLFPFGYGLTYSHFTYSSLSITGAGDRLLVRLTVRNTGSRTAATVPQVYVSAPSAVGEPPQQLKGYTKVVLPPGGIMPVTIALDARTFQHWDTAHSRWITDPGCYRFSVGTSSRGGLLHARRTPSGAVC